MPLASSPAVGPEDGSVEVPGVESAEGTGLVDAPGDDDGNVDEPGLTPAEVGAGVAPGRVVGVGVGFGCGVGVGFGCGVGVGVGCGVGAGVGFGVAEGPITSSTKLTTSAEASVQFFVRYAVAVQVVAPFDDGAAAMTIPTDSWADPPTSQSAFVTACAVTTVGLPPDAATTHDLPAGSLTIVEPRTSTSAGIEILTQPIAAAGESIPRFVTVTSTAVAG
jgi:hypothetical protein